MPIKSIHHVTLQGKAVVDFDLVMEHHRCQHSTDAVRVAITNEARRIREWQTQHKGETENGTTSAAQ